MKPHKRKHPQKLQTITIRQAEATDISQIVNLVNAYALQGTVLPRSLKSVEESLADWLVAEVDTEILGCVSLLRYSSGLVEVRSLVVRDRYHGLGIGSRLMHELLIEAKRRQIPTLFALTRKVPFFNRFGFSLTTKQMFPEKVWFDCQQCPLINNCDESAMVLHLNSEDKESIEPSKKSTD